MKVYRIWCEERYTSGGFSEHDDYATAMVFTTREKAYEHLPNDGKTSYTSWGDYTRYYIKEDEIE